MENQNNYRDLNHSDYPESKGEGKKGLWIVIAIIVLIIAGIAWPIFIFYEEGDSIETELEEDVQALIEEEATVLDEEDEDGQDEEDESDETEEYPEIGQGPSSIASLSDLSVGDEFGPFSIETLDIETDLEGYTVEFSGTARVSTELDYRFGDNAGYFIELQTPSLPIIEERFSEDEEINAEEYYHSFLLSDPDNLLEPEIYDGAQAQIVLADPVLVWLPMGIVPTITLVEVLSIEEE